MSLVVDTDTNIDPADLYAVLGVKRDATPEQMRKAYRYRARKHHPDRNPGDKKAEARFKTLNRAYEVLSDPERRARYDSTGEHGDELNQLPAIYGMLATLLQQIVGAVDPDQLEYMDLLAEMRNCISGKIEEYKRSLLQHQKHKASWQKTATRLRAKEGDNVLSMIAGENATKVELALRKCESELLMLKKTITVLDRYECETKRKEPSGKEGRYGMDMSGWMKINLGGK